MYRKYATPRFLGVSKLKVPFVATWDPASLDHISEETAAASAWAAASVATRNVVCGKPGTHAKAFRKAKEAVLSATSQLVGCSSSFEKAAILHILGQAAAQAVVHVFQPTAIPESTLATIASVATKDAARKASMHVVIYELSENYLPW